MFSLLGFSFAENCHMSSCVKLHIMRTYILPMLKSDLSTFPLRDNNMLSLDVFHRKLLKSSLRLSQSAPSVAIYFLTAELPFKAQLHKEMFSLFYSVSSNPDTKIHEIVKYLLKVSPENSCSWTVHMRHLCRLYKIDDPSEMLSMKPPSRQAFKDLISTKITSFHEKRI